ncbi:hypothetical protein A0H81_06273 [Grifola frondosa]|uniref:Chorismate mutase domain-containing protein n=1 Tax=Grifola frondosa TaxID=5627 RepID=A0A1C7M9Q6_GRIFR|nr:hypothetical protein A0H81_06273 [Grifola frondosa]
MVFKFNLSLFAYAVSQLVVIVQGSSNASDPAIACYNTSLPDIPPSTDNRTIPWGSPSIIFDDGSTCCDSLDEVRAGIDEIAPQLLQLLGMRAAYVREATRFKATRDTVDVPARDAQVIQDAVDQAPNFKLPQTIAQAVFEAIINSSVPFEECVFDEFDQTEGEQ